MRICYVLLSPTFGMHQYTADIANRMAHSRELLGASDSHEVHLITTDQFPRDRYDSLVVVHTPVVTHDTGFSLSSLRFEPIRKVRDLILGLHPDLVHITGPHIWNVPLMYGLSQARVPVVHSLHDLDPHYGSHYGFLLRIWNRMVIRNADHLLVHGEIYRERLLSAGVPRDRVTHTPLLHLFLGDRSIQQLADQDNSVEYRPSALFFGRLERYKGLGCFLAACDMMSATEDSTFKAIIAGPGRMYDQWAGPLPAVVELRNRLIPDAEAVELFRRCGLLVLPYSSATQSALIGSAYYFRKPVLVTRTGALPEYVEDGQTGRVVEPDHPATLARALAEMLSDTAALAQMGAAGRAWYDAQRIIEGQTLLAMYRRVASVHSAGSATVDRQVVPA